MTQLEKVLYTAKADATPVAPKSDDDYVSELKLGTLKSQADILSLATTLEHGDNHSSSRQEE